MSVLGFLFLLFVIYLTYRLVFDFIIPVYRTTKKIRRGFKEMQERMSQHTQEPFQQQQAATQSQNNNGRAGEYIDFEEVK